MFSPHNFYIPGKTEAKPLWPAILGLSTYWIYGAWDPKPIDNIREINKVAFIYFNINSAWNIKIYCFHEVDSNDLLEVTAAAGSENNCMKNLLYFICQSICIIFELKMYSTLLFFKKYKLIIEILFYPRIRKTLENLISYSSFASVSKAFNCLMLKIRFFCEFKKSRNCLISFSVKRDLIRSILDYAYIIIAFV